MVIKHKGIKRVFTPEMYDSSKQLTSFEAKHSILSSTSTFTSSSMTKIVWITGASSGIGEALAHEWAAKGALLILSARNRAKLDAVNIACGGNHLVLPLDMENDTNYEQAVVQAWSWQGRVDIAVHNAGISQRARAEEVSDIALEKIMQVNFIGAAKLARLQLLRFQEQKSGHFVVITSLSGKFGVPYRSVYCASKHALHGYFDSLRAENATYPIRVTIVAPGYIKTDVSINALGPEGVPTGVMDDNQAKGLPVDVCAKAIVKAVGKHKEELIIGGPERFGVFLKRFFPGILSKVLAKRAGY
jgi:dehydrogenase/reductase SDR family member 7B